MLFKLSINNIRKSVRDYAVYFFTLVIGVAVFYIFNSIETQTAFLEMSQNQREIIALLISMLSGLSVFVAVVLGLLIVYASRFLMKRRSKEFAVYLTLGMGKGKISAIIFIETLIIGLISLAVGIGAGICISQYMSVFAASLFEANLSEYHFVVSGAAILKTVIFFGIIYTAVMLFNGFIVGRCKLIDLIQSGRKSEKIKLKNPILCVIVFLSSAIALGYAYYTVINKVNALDDKTMGIMILIGSVSTFTLLWSVSGMLLRAVTSLKKVYFRNLNSFTFRQLSSMINTMVTSMTIICLMLFVTICTLTSAFSMRNSLNGNINKFCPADCQIQYSNGNNNERLTDAIGSEFLSYFSEYCEIEEYYCDTAAMKILLSDCIDEVKRNNPYLDISYQYPIYKISDFNALMALYGKEKLTINEGEYIFVSNYSTAVAIYNPVLNGGKELIVFGNKLTPKYSECIDSFAEISVQPMNDGLIVVPDSVIENQTADMHYFTGIYNGNTKAERITIEEKVFNSGRSLKKKLFETGNEFTLSCETRNELAESASGLGGVVIFIGLYLGLIFLISSGVILALRSLSDAVDSIPRYTMLRKIGADESEISKSLLCQTALFFAIPLILACIHSIFGMKFAMSYILQIFGTEGMAKSIAGSGIIILLIYGGYFLITYFCSKSIIREKR